MPTAIYHEQVELPLYHVKYEVFVADDMSQLRQHINSIFPGLHLEVADHHGGYSAVITHPTNGVTLMVLINSKERMEGPSVQRTIFHECTHLSWNIMEGLGLKANADDNEAQAYLMEELIDNVARVVRESKEHLGDISDL